MHMLHSMSITANREEVLQALCKNRETHAKIVAEARVGYVEKARAALEKRLDEIQSGKVISLVFSLKPPQDHTKTYDTVIKMMEMHIEPTVTLTAEQVRNLIQDEWDWKRDFLVGSARYSKTADDILNG